MILWLMNIDFAGGGGVVPPVTEDWDIVRSMTLGFHNPCPPSKPTPCPPTRRFRFTAVYFKWALSAIPSFSL